MRAFKSLKLFFASLCLLIPLGSCYYFPFEEFSGTWKNEFMTLNAYNYNLTKKRPDGTITLDNITYEFYGSGRSRGVFFLNNKEDLVEGYVFSIWECTISVKNEKLILKVYRDFLSDYEGKKVILYQTSDEVYVP